MRIAKIIHQTCKNPDSLDNAISANIEALKQRNPSWEYRIYSDAEVLAYIKQHLGNSVYGLLQRLNPEYGVILADLFRYLVIYNEGGVYLDIKSGALKPLDEVIKDTDIYLLSQWRNKLGEEFTGAGLFPELTRVPGGELQQWHIVAAAGHPFLAAVIRQVIQNIESYDSRWTGVGFLGVMRLSGPICYTLSIMPLLGKHSHRLVDMQDLGFQYSMLATRQHKFAHVRNNPEHYSKATTPLFFNR